jgi:broad specificity phosphatase PhoE
MVSRRSAPRRNDEELSEGVDGSARVVPTAAVLDALERREQDRRRAADERAKARLEQADAARSRLDAEHAGSERAVLAGSEAVGDQVAELTVARHGQSMANVAFTAAQMAERLDCAVSGPDADVELSPLGWRQTEALGRWLAGLPPERRPEVVVCSPYVRARQTWQCATDTAGDLGAQLPRANVDPRLGDRLMGELELLTTAMIAERFPAEVARRRDAEELTYCPPGGESFGDIAVRLDALMHDLHARYAGRRVFLVAHDAVVLMLRYVIEQLTFDELATIMRDGPVANASLTRFDGSSGRLQLVQYNAVDHLFDETAGVVDDG